MTAGTQGAPFRRRTALLIAACGILAFLATLVMGAYAPDLRSGSNGGTHGLSNSAVGYSMLVKLADRTGQSPEIVRNDRYLDREEMVIISPDSPLQDLSEILALRGGRITLLILPKWETRRDPSRPQWVWVTGLMHKEFIGRTLAPSNPLTISQRKGTGASITAKGFLAGHGIDFREPRVIQTLSGPKVEPLLTDGAGGAVLARVGDRQLFVLADPDLLNNHGMADRQQAQSALALLATLNATDADRIIFDVTTNGLGHGRSPLRLMFDPPFLAVTIVLFIAFLMAGWQATTRFGEAVVRPRAIAFGKRALIDNSAAMVRRAGRELSFGIRYADVVRALAVERFALPRALAAGELDKRLDQLADRPFTPLAERLVQANSRPVMLNAARRLHRWLEETST